MARTAKPVPEPKPKAIAPSDDPVVIARICELLGEGVGLRTILREEPGMPAVTTFYTRLMKESAEFNPRTHELIAQARARGYDALAEECLLIANTPLEGQETTTDEKGTSIKKGDMLGHRKLQIETRLKLLAKWDPKRYGERLNMEHSGELTLTGLAGRMRKQRGSGD